jgi:hypothetical protein
VSVSDVSVSENGRQYAPGASAKLGSSGAPGTYGTANLGNAYRIVWHYRATDEERTFTVTYRLNGLAVAYDDVVDVYWQAWGDEWQEPLDSLDAAMNLPGDPQKGEVKVFGHPASVNGETSLGPGRVSPTLLASDVPPEQFVEMRVVFPRELLTSTGGARVEQGDGLQKIMDQEAAEASSEARALWLQRLQPVFALLLVALAAGLMLFVYLRYGREHKVDYGERYEREPPTDDPPAVVSAIMGQKPSVGTREFTATLFDLIRRGVLEAQPVSVKQGGLLGEKTITDLRVDAGYRDRDENYERSLATLKDFERKVLNVALRVLHRGPVNLTHFEERIKDDREANRSSYNSFTDDLKRDVEGRDLVERSAGRRLGPVAFLLGLAGIAWFVLSLFGLNIGAAISPMFANFIFFAIGVAIVWFLFRRVLAGSALNQLWVRRTPERSTRGSPGRQLLQPRLRRVRRRTHRFHFRQPRERVLQRLYPPPLPAQEEAAASAAAVVAVAAVHGSDR